MDLSICYITARAEPRIEWVLQGLSRQVDQNDTIQLIIVDALGRTRGELVPDVPKAISVVAVSPKPNRAQGKYRALQHDVWAKSQAANTALCLARYDYVAFLDDRSILGGRWLATVREGCRQRRSVLAGTYTRVLSKTQVEMDHRRKLHPKGKLNCGGTWLYGCTFALPLEWALQVNGFEEGLDGFAQEDCVFGFNLENAGYQIDFEPSLCVELYREPSTEHFYKRKIEGEDFQAALKYYRTLARTAKTPDLRILRERVMTGQPFPIPA